MAEVGIVIPNAGNLAGQITSVTQCIALADACGFDRIRVDGAFNEILATTTTSTYTAIYNAIDLVGATSMKLLIVMELLIPTGVASWEALTGGAYTATTGSVWPVWKRPPAGTANACWDKMAERINLAIVAIKTRWLATGRDLSDLMIQCRNEVGFGGAGGPHESTVKTAAEAYLDGAWDTDAHWAAFTWAGRNGSVVVRGGTEIANYIIPLLDFQGIKICEASFECGTTTNYIIDPVPVSGDGFSHELTTCRAAGVTYDTSASFTAAVTHYAVNCGAGAMLNRIMSPSEYADLSAKCIMDRLARVKEANADFNSLKMLCTEHAIPWLNMLGIRAQNRDYRGYIWAEVVRRFKALPIDCVYIYTMKNEADALATYYGFITAANTYCPEISRIADVLGGSIDTGQDPPGPVADGVWEVLEAGQNPISDPS